MAPIYQSGDLVKLRSGGPRMTIESVTTEQGVPLVHCVWFDKLQVKRMKTGTATLVKFDEAEFQRLKAKSLARAI
jgi:uncharacterized protein YodC (DUF2158 family)